MLPTPISLFTVSTKDIVKTYSSKSPSLTLTMILGNPRRVLFFYGGYPIAGQAERSIVPGTDLNAWKYVARDEQGCLVTVFEADTLLTLSRFVRLRLKDQAKA